jgi:uncharacterized protein YbaP (TraB family)
MNRREFVLALLAFSTGAWSAPERYGRGLLWRVTKKGAPPSYVYGTIHSQDQRVAELPGPVRAAFSSSRRLMVEFMPDSYTTVRFAESAMYLDSRTLEQEIGAPDFELALERLKPAGLTRDFVNKMKPWGVLLNLREGGQGNGTPPDTQLAALARERRMPLSQIEGVEEQIFTFDEFPMASQVALLRHSLANREELAALAEETVRAYLARDLAAIWRLREAHAARHPGIAAHQAVMTKRVVLDRNVVMAFRMQRELRRGEAFVALGALHLYGAKGVLALLEEDGYRATRVF